MGEGARFVYFKLPFELTSEPVSTSGINHRPLTVERELDPAFSVAMRHSKINTDMLSSYRDSIAADRSLPRMSFCPWRTMDTVVVTTPSSKDII